MKGVARASWMTRGQEPGVGTPGRRRPGPRAGASPRPASFWPGLPRPHALLPIPPRLAPGSGSQPPHVGSVCAKDGGDGRLSPGPGVGARPELSDVSSTAVG